MWINDNLAAIKGWREGKDRWEGDVPVAMEGWGVEGWIDRGTFLQWRGYGWIDGEISCRYYKMMMMHLLFHNFSFPGAPERKISSGK